MSLSLISDGLKFENAKCFTEEVGEDDIIPYEHTIVEEQRKVGVIIPSIMIFSKRVSAYSEQ